MAWFDSKRIIITIRDKEIEKNVRKDSYRYLAELAYVKGLDYIKELIKQEKLSENVIHALARLIDLEKGALFRGIHVRNFEYFLRHGNDKTSENVSDIEAWKLKKLGLDPSEVIYATPNLEKAWEYVRRENPSIVVLYDGGKFERVPGEFYLFRIKKGEDFRNAVKAFVIVKYE